MSECHRDEESWFPNLHHTFGTEPYRLAWWKYWAHQRSCCGGPHHEPNPSQANTCSPAQYSLGESSNQASLPPPQGSAVFYSYLFMVSVFPNRSSHQKDASTHLPPPQASLIQVRQQVHDSRMEELLVAPTPWCDMATHGFAFVTCGFSMALVSYMFSNLSIS